MIIAPYNELLFISQVTLPWGSTATSTQTPSPLLGDCLPTWRHQGVWILKADKSLLFLPSPGRGYPMGNRVLPLLTKTEMEESRKRCFPASEMRLCAPSVSGITFRNIVLLPYLSRREQLLIPPPQKSLWLVSTFTGWFFYFCHMQNIY